MFLKTEIMVETNNWKTYVIVRLGLRLDRRRAPLSRKQVVQNRLKSPQHQQQKERGAAQIGVALRAKVADARRRRFRHAQRLGRTVRWAQRVDKQHRNLFIYYFVFVSSMTIDKFKFLFLSFLSTLPLCDALWQNKTTYAQQNFTTIKQTPHSCNLFIFISSLFFLSNKTHQNKQRDESATKSVDAPSGSEQCHPPAFDKCGQW